MSDSRTRILTNIRAGLKHNRAFLESESRRAPHTPPPYVHPREHDLATQFATELTKLTGRVHRCTDDEAALDAIETILSQPSATTIVAWEPKQIGLRGLTTMLEQRGVSVLDGHIARADDRSARLQGLDPTQVCISGAEVGIAESGTLVLLTGAGRGRLASLVAPVHVAVLRESQLVRGLGEALALLQQRHGAILDDHSAITLITGPSRTADIEMTLTLGVHGPREIHVVLIEEPGARNQESGACS